MTTAAAPLFQLTSVTDDSPFPLHVPSLPSIAPQFCLPHLDDALPGADRLLQSLTSSLLLHHANAGPGSPTDKGKQKEDAPCAAQLRRVTTDVHGRELSRSLEKSVWDAVASEAEAGRSCARVFEPIRSWDDLRDPIRSQAGPTFFSEGPGATFEALVTSSDPSFHLPKLKHDDGSIPIDSGELLDLLIRSTLATTTSECLRWDRRHARFWWDTQKRRPEGFSGVTADASMRHFLEIGTAIRRLEIVVDNEGSKPATPSHHAFYHAVAIYLTFMKGRLTAAVDIAGKRVTLDWSMWISEFGDVRQLAGALCEIMGWPLGSATAQAVPARASALLSHIYSHLHSRLSTASLDQQRGPIMLALAYLLKVSSSPLLVLLHQWVGLADASIIDQDSDADSQPWSDLGITRSNLPSSDNGESRWDYTFSAKRMPAFIPKETRRTLFEAGRSLRLLNEASCGHHPLCGGSWDIGGRWGWGEAGTTERDLGTDLRAHTRRVNREVDHWRRSVRHRARPLPSSGSLPRLRRPNGKDRKKLPLDFVQASMRGIRLELKEEEKTRAENDLEHDPLWSLFDRSPGSHLQSDKPTALWGPTPLEDLHHFLAHHLDMPLLPPDTPNLEIFVSNRLLAPLLTHANLISVALVSHYLDDLDFLDHLDVLGDFWLGGDFGFAERVGGALFGKEEAGAGEALGLGRRARTRARLGLGHVQEDAQEGQWGIALGLGLSERQRWPPGGAELAYALRATLLTEDGSIAGKMGSVWDEIEDKVSFAIRALPEGEVDGRRARWLDPQAIEALDFLYLSYAPPASISNLLPAAIMEKYQTIHNFLLRIGRVDAVVRTLFHDIAHHSHHPLDSRKTGVDARSRASSRAHTRAPRAQRDLLGLDLNTTQRLHRLRFRISHFVSAVTQYVLDIAIGTNWSRMRRRLEKLKQRVPGRDSSRPVTPSSQGEGEYFDFEDLLDNMGDDDEQPMGDVRQLKSIHALIQYHHLTLDKIFRACLLSSLAGHQVTYQVLMKLFGLVLDLGKLVKERQREVRSAEDAEARIAEISQEWEERETVFLHALERLSLRSSHPPIKPDPTDEERADATGEDLRILMQGPEGEGGDGVAAREQLGGLGELLVRLRINQPLKSVNTPV